DGPSILANDVQAGDEGKEFRALILTRPSGGTIFFYEDGSFDTTVFPDGVHTGTYEGFADGVSYGTAPYSLRIGLQAITGTIAAVEAGVDSASVAGVVRVAGSIAATETGTDT